LISQSRLPAAVSTDSPATSSASGLLQPKIEYHFADDSPQALLPTTEDETVIILDYDPNSTSPLVAGSTDKSIAVTGVKYTDFPGHQRMYVIETTTALSTQYALRVCSSQVSSHSRTSKDLP